MKIPLPYTCSREPVVGVVKRVSRSPEELDEKEWNRLQEIVERFEGDAADSFPRDLDPYLPPPSDPIRIVVLQELLRTDLEMQWRRGPGKQIEDYLKKYPELDDPEFQCSLLMDEFRLRVQYGSEPTSQECKRRFPEYYTKLAGMFADDAPPDAPHSAEQQNAELQKREKARNEPPKPASPQPSTKPATPVPKESRPETERSRATPIASAALDSSIPRSAPLPPSAADNFRRWKAFRDGDDGTQLFRPRKRQPQPRLVMFDDDGMPGEIVVIRESEFRIGREQGQFLIPHDLLISGRHACFRWREGVLTLSDEGSRNGTFWRLRPGATWALADGDRFLCGRQVYQLALDGQLAKREPSNEASKWMIVDEEEKPPEHAARLVKVGDLDGSAREFRLAPDRMNIIGRQPGLEVAVPNDDCISPKHAVIRFLPDREMYVLEDLNSLNGVFIRIARPTVLQNGDMVRLGEQLIGVLLSTRKHR